MTALRKYARLECSGLWRAAPGAQRREVVVNFGEASLILSDGRTETALSHWSLPALRRMNPGQRPALYTPATEAAETLEIDDEAMIEAIETVRRAVAARRPHPGRLRGGIFAAILAGTAALGVFWLPDALTRHTAAVVPPAKRAEIGRLALADLARLTGAPCTSAFGNPALARLSERLFGPGGAEIVILRRGLSPSAHLPGRLVLLDRALVEQYDSPAVAAGHALAERLRAEAADPLVGLLRAAGLRATFRLLTTGDLPEGALRGYGEQLLARPPAPVDQAALQTRLGVLGLPAAPYAQSVGAALPAGDGGGGANAEILPDADWIGLQGICSD